MSDPKDIVVRNIFSIPWGHNEAVMDYSEYLDKKALAILSALEAEGWKLIRRDVTVEMNCAAWKLVRDRWPKGQLLGPGPCFREAMQAMIDAAPTWGKEG